MQMAMALARAYVGFYLGACRAARWKPGQNAESRFFSERIITNGDVLGQQMQ